VAEVDEHFLNWLAGFWEGEGYFTIRRDKGGWHHCRFGIAQTDTAPLKEISEKLGVGYVRLSEKRRKPNYSDKWVWEVGNRVEIIKVAELLLPYLRFRKFEVEDKLRKVKELQAKNPNVGKRLRRYSKEEEEFIKSRWELSDKELARILGRSISSLRHKRQRLGMVKSPKRKYDWEAMKEDYLSGLSSTDISKKYGCSPKTVQKIMQNFGVTRERVQALRLAFERKRQRLNKVENLGGRK